MRGPDDWDAVALTGEPVLVIGWRKTNTLVGATVDLTDTTFATFIEVAETALERLGRQERRPWEPDAELEEGEQFFAISTADLPALTPPRRSRRQRPETEDRAVPDQTGDPALSQLAALPRLLFRPGTLTTLDASQLGAGTFNFYAIVLREEVGDQPIAFVRAVDPTRIIKKARWYFSHSGALQQVRRPDFALDDDIDLVVTPEEVAVCRPIAFDRLFFDVRALLNDVPANAQILSDALTELPMAAVTRQSFINVCQSRPTFARRLQRLAHAIDGASVTPATLREVLTTHGLSPDDFLDVNNHLKIEDGNVRTFLDVAEGRWYQADFTGAARRADRWSSR